MLRRWFITNPLAAMTFLGFYIDTLLARPEAIFRLGGKWSRQLLFVSGVKVTVTGAVPPGGPFVIVGNHQSLVDTPLLLGFLGTEFRFIAKSSLFRLPIIGTHLRRGGHIAVARDDGRAALESLARAQGVLKDQRISVVVFAEGTRSPEGLQEFKSGAAHLAIQAGVPVLPIALNGTAAALPRGKFTVRVAKVKLAIGEPIPTTGMTRRDREALSLQVRDAVGGLLQGISG